MKKILNNCKVNVGAAVVLIIFLFVFSLNVLAQSDTIQTNVPALKDVYKNDFYIGCILSYPHIGFPSDPSVSGQSAVVAPNGGYLVKYHMNSMTPGNNMKPQYTVDLNGSASAYTSASGTAKDSINVHPIIRFNGNLIAQLNWAKRQGFTFRGHTLVWHSQTPGTGFFRTGYSSTGTRLTKEKMTERLENYIKEVIRLIHEGWPGLVSAIDVVNEAITDDGADRTTDSEWYVTFGDNSYLMKAFELARKYTVQYGETQVKLYYNDYNTSIPVKADGIVRICGPIFRAGFLDGIGMQEHDANNSPTAEQWIATYNKLDTVCSQMAITELDVTTGSANPSSSVLNTQANQYGQLYKCFVERSYFSGRGKIINVTKDGLNDQYTFKTNQSSSLWDAQNKCKPSFFAAANVGIYYNEVDTLVAYAETLQQSNYTSGSWAPFADALAAAKNSMSRNYSASESAADILAAVNTNLQSAIDGLIMTGVPVELVSFTGKAEGNKIILTWQTATEKNNSGFEVQRRNNNNEFSKVGFVNGSGTSAESHSYSFTENISGSDKYYYRLKQVDLDGTFSYSNVAEISVMPTAFSLSQNYPNPFNPVTTIQFSLPVTTEVHLILYDILGNVVKEIASGIYDAGYHQVKFDGTGLTSGIYFYRMQTDKFVEVKKLMLMK